MNKMTAESFSIELYGEILDAFNNKDYEFVDFDSVNPNRREIVLRHDIDVCLSRAADFAEEEKRLGYKSHYFVLMTSAQYNPASQIGRICINRILDAGHRVGLHFDAALECKESIEKRGKREVKELSELIGSDISMVSFHRPTKKWINNPENIFGLPHTYQPKFFSNIGYCSDSRGGWYNGNPISNKAIKEQRALQLLTHPIWWVGPPLSAIERLESYLVESQKRIKADLNQNITLLKNNT